MSQRTLLIAAAVILVGLFGYLAWSEGVFDRIGDSPSTDEFPRSGSVDGRVLDIAASAKVITVNSSKAEVSVAITSDTRFTDKNGQAVSFAYIRPGFSIRAEGSFTRGDSLKAELVRVTDEPNIIVTSPAPNEEIGLPVLIKGEARVFEAAFSYRIKNKDGSVLVESNGMTGESGVFSPFEVRVTYPKPKMNEGSIEVFEYSAKDGSEINKVTIPVRFKTTESASVKVYFSNRIKDPGALNCSQVYSVERRIEKTEAIAKRSLEELLEGPTMTESQQGYFTSINSGVQLNTITIKNGVATADFNEMLEVGVAGSCRVTAIRSEITQTLLQFPTIQSVIISVNGRTEDVLQP
jgi:hypothetical protein